MNYDAIARTPRRKLAALVIGLVATFGATYALPAAQTPDTQPAARKKALTVDDYSRWREHQRLGDLG